jgi:hypothetical protein
MDPSPSNNEAPDPGKIVWDAPVQQTAPAGAPSPSNIVWDQAPDESTFGMHTLRALGRGVLGALGEMTGDPPDVIAHRNKVFGLAEPEGQKVSTVDKVAEFAGGMAAPSPSGIAGKAASGLSAARATDTAAGTTLGQQSGNTFTQMIERTLARLPGGGALVDSVRKQTERLADTTDDIVRRLSGGGDTSATGAGKVLQQQGKEAGKAMKKAASDDYEQLEKLIPPKATIVPKSTLETLDQLTSTVPHAEELSGKLLDKDLVSYKEALQKDMENSRFQGLPYSTLKELRTKIGQQIDWGPFSTDMRNGRLKQIYSALSADLQNGAAHWGGEKGAAEVARVNAAYAASKEQQKVLSSVIKKAGGPEQVFASLMSGTREGASKLQIVLANIDQPSRQLLAASALQRMGKATAGAQNATSAVFSADTFLTNWNKMSPEARQALFGSLPGDYAQSISQLSANVASLKAYSKIIPNPSNTAQAALWGGEVGSALMAILTGHPGAAAAIGGTMASTAVLSAALTNPQTAKYLASQTGKMLLRMVQGKAGTEGDSQRPSTLQ